MERARQLRTFSKRAIGVEPRVRETVHPRLEFHGNSAGGWKIVADSLARDSVVVDVGLGEDISFSESLIAKYDCLVSGFDPTPRAIAYVEKKSNPRLRLFELAVGGASGVAEFFLPANRQHVSGSISHERHLGEESIRVRVITIAEVMELLGISRIDLLKLDIEGTEYDVIESADFGACAGCIDQLCVEFHHRWQGRGKGSTECAVAKLQDLGFDCAWYSRSSNEEFLFVRRGSRLTDDA